MKRKRAADWLFVLASVWLYLQKPGGSLAADQEAIGSAISTFVLTYATPLLAYLVLRTLTVHLVLRSMMKRASGPVETEEAAEVATPESNLRFLELDSAKGVLLGDSCQGRLERALETGPRTLGIFWQSVLAFVAAAAIVLYKFFPRAADPANGTPAIDVGASQVDFGAVAWMGAGFVICAAIGLGVVITIGTATMRYRSIRRVSLWSCACCVGLLTALAAGVGRLLSMPWYAYALPPICAALVVIYGYASIRRTASADGNITLLILRVFGADANTAFVFGPLMRSWRFLGSFFTIVDPSYIRYQFSLSSSETRWKLLRTLGVIGVVVAGLSWIQYGLFEILPLASPGLAAWGDLEEHQQQRLLGMVVWLLLIPMAMLPVVWAVRSRFVGSSEELERRTGRAVGRPVGMSGVFSGRPLYCYDNVWKKAVHSLLTSVDAVLMDLRGFSPERRGCEYEIGVLLNRYPLQQTVFLVDRGEASRAVYDTIRRAWGSVTATSPNHRLESPTVKVYAPIGDEERDAPRILALLVASATTAEGSGTALVRFEESESGGKIEAPRRSVWRWTSVGLRLGEVVDTAIATPKYARVLIPLMVAAVTSMFYVSLRPVLAGYAAYRDVVTATLSTPASANGASDTSDVVAPSAPSETMTTPAATSGSEPTANRSVTLHATATALIQDSGGFAKGRSYSRPLAVIVDLTGGSAAEAVRYGRVTLEPAQADTGDALELLSIGDFSSDLKREFVGLDRNERDFFTKDLKHPQDGVRLSIMYFSPEKAFGQIKNLSGTAMLQTIDPEQTVRMENVGARATDRGIIALRHPKLDEIGEFSLIFRDAEHPQLIVKGVRLPELDARLVDAAGEIAPSAGTGTASWDGMTTKNFDFAMDMKSLRTARLEIFLGYKSFTAPFSFVDIPVKK